MNNIIEARLIELETRLAYQDEALRELNEAMVRQQHEIMRLEQLCLALRQRVATLSAAASDNGSGGPVVDEKPPHY